MIIQGKDWNEIKEKTLMQDSKFRIEIYGYKKSIAITYDCQEEEREILLCIHQSFKPPYTVFFFKRAIKGAYTITQKAEVTNYD